MYEKKYFSRLDGRQVLVAKSSNDAKLYEEVIKMHHTIGEHKNRWVDKSNIQRLRRYTSINWDYHKYKLRRKTKQWWVYTSWKCLSLLETLTIIFEKKTTANKRMKDLNTIES